MSDTKVQTVEDLLLLFNQLPESEKILILQRLPFSAPPQFDGEKFTEVYKGRLIEVYRTEVERCCDDGEWWGSDYVNLEGKRISEAEFGSSPEQCLEFTRAEINFEIEQIEQNEMSSKIKEMFSQFQAKEGYTQSNLLNALSKALSDSLDEAEWKKQVIRVLENAAISAWLPERMLP